jgi:hypothetical protein
MITTKQRIALKKLLRGDYIADVKNKLKERHVLSKNNTPYSDKMISHVFNGRYSNLEIQNAILDVYIERKEKHDRDNQRRNDILGISSPDDNDDEE